MGRSWESRVAEYVDSDRLSQRLKAGNIIMCNVAGNSGNYRTETGLKTDRKSNCTCPSDYFPCKHVAALKETYRLRPRSFADLDRIIVKLAKNDKAALLKIVRQMILRAPEALDALGVKGFEREEPDYDY